MALTTGDGINKWDSAAQIESSGASVSAGAMSAGATTTVDNTVHQDALLVDVVLVPNFGSAPAAGKFAGLYAGPRDVDGTSGHDAPAPSTSYKSKQIGTPQRIAQASGVQYLYFDNVHLPSRKFDLHWFNGSDVAASWMMYVIPRTARAKA